MSTSPALAARARDLLRRLRDRNLGARRVALRAGRSVGFHGCTSIDAPAESGVRYRLVLGRRELELELCAPEGGGLELRLRDTGGRPRGQALRVDLALDAEQRLVSRALAARIDLERAGERELDHFLRRVVRTAFARPSLQRTG